MWIRIPRLIGRKLYLEFRKWEIRKQLTVRPMIRIEVRFYPGIMKTKTYGKVRYTDIKYYIVIGGRKK